jgi:CheY-like chemotaxis protein
MSKTIKILFLAASPQDMPPLKLDKEVRGIDLALRQTEFRDRFDIKQHWAVRVTDLQSYLLRYRPDIVHFSGHGSISSQIILEDNYGNSHPVSPRALSQVFSVLKDNIRCVVLNACYSEQQAQAIAQHIDCVVGMSKAIGDAAAINFAMAFYQALGYGRNVKTAFDLGCAQIDLENLDEQDTPKLLAANINPMNINIVEDMHEEHLLQGALDLSNVVAERKQPPASLGEVTDQKYKLVMIIDDSLNTRIIVETVLRREGFECKSFADGIEAISWLKSPHGRNPHLIFLDVGLPKMDGYEIARYIKKELKLKDTVIVMLTAQGGTANRIKAYRLGIKGFIHKPYHTAEIIAAVRLHVGLPNLN